MATGTRFGRRLPIPSTRQIRRELLTFAVKEDARKAAIADEKVAVPNEAVPPPA